MQRIGEDANRRENSKLFNDGLLAAVAAMGHTDSAAVRLCAVVATARLADDWREQRQVCIDMLCGYLHLPYQPERGQDGWKEGEREVRLSIITIRDHLCRPIDDPLTWQGRDFDFTGAVFDGGDFSSTHFSGGQISFIEAVFSSGKVDFTRAAFSGAVVSFSRAARICLS